MDLFAVLLTGLLAGGLSCAAVQGGLLTGLVTRQKAMALTAGGRIVPVRQPPPPRKTAHTKRPAANTKSQAKGKGKGKHPYTARAVEPPQPLAQRLKTGLTRLRADLTDDLAPVGAFMGGKLVSHTVLGLLLGGIGAAVTLPPSVRVWTQLAAGTLIIAFGLAQLGWRPLKNFTVSPPASWTRFVRGRARSQAAFAPAILGFVTILIPCGITLSVMTLALTSGSAWAGAATMAVFVIGTTPLFTALGYAAKRASRAAGAWHSRLAVATGLVVVALGAYTFNGGLTLADSGLAANNLPQTLGLVDPPAVASADVVRVAHGRQELVVTARTGSFSPANIAAKAGVPTTLVIRSNGVNGCIRSFVIPSLDRQWTLPKDGDTRIDLGTLQPGKLRYTCSMGMYSGQITTTA